MKKITKQFVKWLTRTRFLALPRKVAARAVLYAIESGGMVVLSYADERRKVIEQISDIKKNRSMLLELNEAYQIFMAVQRTTKIDGDLAEVGVYRGASAKLIREANAEKPLHLFDTFEGLPTVDKIDESKFYEGQFSSSYEDVQNYLREYKEVHLYPGLFPSTAAPIENKIFSFIHLDVDTYQSTLSCLQFFYTRMNRGGVILSHDYINAAGVRKAFDEFFEEKPEPIIEMSGTQCLVVKV